MRIIVYRRPQRRVWAQSCNARHRPADGSRPRRARKYVPEREKDECISYHATWDGREQIVNNDYYYYYSHRIARCVPN